MTSKNTVLSLAILFALFFSPFLVAATPQSGPLVSDNESIVGEGADAVSTIFHSFQSQEIVPITLKTNLSKLIKEKERGDYQGASITITNKLGETITKDIKVRPRGKSRRKLCSFPPIKIKFSKSDLEEDGLVRSFNTLKLVTHCYDSRPSEQNLLKEFLAYKIYNQLTDNSFRVQLVEIKYEDTEGKLRPMTKYGFIIENNDELAERLGSKNIKRYNLPIEEMNELEYHTLHMFQYMIGNTDWKIDMIHNVKIMQLDENATPVVVPYDFDFSGLVNAHYARPHPDYTEIFRVRDRYYTAKQCPSEAVINQTIELFEAKKEAILELCSNFELLNKGERKDITRFIKRFYDTIEKPSRVKGAFFKACK
ncbi:MAG: hypothetical protein AAGG75_23795 [Bacteroidota bacterium]